MRADCGFAGRMGDAEAELRSILEIDPAYPHALALLGLIYAQEGRFEEALPMTEQAHVSMPWSPLVAGALAAICVRTRNMSRADALTRNLKKGPDQFLPVGLAIFYALSGEMEEAAEWAARAIEYRHSTFSHDLAPFFRSTPRWPRLAKLMNLPV
jgi:tetratricopeptide (TPR) repeat protein